MSRTAEEWGRLAVSLPGWRWMPGMLTMWSLDEDPVMPLRLTEDAGAGHPGVSNPVWSGVRSDREYNDHEADPEWCWPDPEDPATAGCLLALLGGAVELRIGSRRNVAPWVHECIVGDGQSHDGRIHTVRQPTIGRACIAAAEAIGRWPGGVACD
jgi:hypothetical protein